MRNAIRIFLVNEILGVHQPICGLKTHDNKSHLWFSPKKSTSVGSSFCSKILRTYLLLFKSTVVSFVENSFEVLQRFSNSHTLSVFNINFEINVSDWIHYELAIFSSSDYQILLSIVCNLRRQIQFREKFN